MIDYIIVDIIVEMIIIATMEHDNDDYGEKAFTLTLCLLPFDDNDYHYHDDHDNFQTLFMKSFYRNTVSSASRIRVCSRQQQQCVWLLCSVLIVIVIMMIVIMMMRKRRGTMMKPAVE